jgi:hypothetical protein
MTDRGWGRPFEDPIEVAGSKLVTLRDAGEVLLSSLQMKPGGWRQGPQLVRARIRALLENTLGSCVITVDLLSADGRQLSAACGELSTT